LFPFFFPSISSFEEKRETTIQLIEKSFCMSSRSRPTRVIH
jgi:hypothetical protein